MKAMTALMSHIETHGDRTKYLPVGPVAISEEIASDVSAKLIWIP
jgi:hypothetical protein